MLRILAAILACGLFVCTAQLDPTEAELQHAVIIDAGSSGSRVHVYRFSHAPGDLYPHFRLPDASMKVKPGISSFAADPAAAGQSLAPLLEYARHQVPEHLQADVPVRLFATAGVRLLPEAEAAAVLESCRAALAASGFATAPDGVGVISGVQEGLYAWVAANYASGALQARALRRADRKIASRHRGHADVVGVIEMGGASIQVTFEPDEADQPTAAGFGGMQQLTIPGADRPIFTHSFLGLGMDQAMLHAASQVAGEGADSDPCVPVGATSLSGVPGAGNFDGCAALTSTLLDTAGCEATPCALGGVAIPPLTPDMRLIATENFHHTRMALGLPPNATLREVGDAGAAWCATDYATLVAANVGHLGPHEVAKWCFSAAFMVTLLRDAWGLALDDAHLTFTNSLLDRRAQEVPVDWALGAVVMQAMQAKEVERAASAAAIQEVLRSRALHLALLVGAGVGLVAVVAALRCAPCGRSRSFSSSWVDANGQQAKPISVSASGGHLPGLAAPPGSLLQILAHPLEALSKRGRN